VKVSTSRGRLLLGERGREYPGQSEPAPSLTQPIDDLLGLAPGDVVDVESGYFWHLLRYGPFWGGGVGTDPLWEKERSRWRKWAVQFSPRLLKAARRAQDGRLSALLAPELERVRYTPGRGSDEVPDGDLPALATWCLVEVLRREPITVEKCRRCKRPWLVQPGQVYCQRPAPGHVRDCRTLAKEEAFLSSEEVRGYRREYKRLHELKRRGTITMAQLNAWRQGNTPSDWKPYKQWLETKEGGKS
jgi:hypothetical protein